MNWAVESQKMVKSLKVWIYEVEELYYVTKTRALISYVVTTQLIFAFVSAYAKADFLLMQRKYFLKPKIKLHVCSFSASYLQCDSLMQHSTMGTRILVPITIATPVSLAVNEDRSWLAAYCGPLKQ